VKSGDLGVGGFDLRLSRIEAEIEQETDEEARASLILERQSLPKGVSLPAICAGSPIRASLKWSSPISLSKPVLVSFYLEGFAEYADQ
jgi:hypothetical protein